MFNSLGLALGMTLKCYTSVAKGLKVENFWGAKFYVCRSYRGKTGRIGGTFCPPS